MSLKKVAYVKINIQGYYGKKNTGDDALISSVVFGIEERVKEVDYYISSTLELVLPVEGKRVSYLSNKQRFRGHQRLQILFQELICDWTLYGGGSLINDSSGIDFLKRMLRTVKIKKLLGHKVGMLGIGIGPLNSIKAKEIASKIISQLDFIAVRDRASAELCKSLARTEPVVADDLAMLMLKSTAFNQESRIVRVPGKKVLGISLCHYDRYLGENIENDETRMEKFLTALKGLHFQYKCDFALFEFNGNELFGDGPLMDVLTRELKPLANVYCLPYVNNPAQVLKDVGQCDAFLAMRLHSAIFSCLSRIPVVMIDYHPKCRAFSRQIKLKREDVLCSEDFSAETLMDRLKSILDNSLLNYELCENSNFFDVEKNFNFLLD